VRDLLATTGSPALEAQGVSSAPLLAHWLYFHSFSPMTEVAPDGHEKGGVFLPPVNLPRRMWAGSRVDFLRPLRIGASIARRSMIADVQEKAGRSGKLIFVRVEHRVSDESGPVLRESQDIVYRDLPATDGMTEPPKLAPTTVDWARRIEPNPVLLFRYSALTFNSHRIHYDRTYVTEVEGYPGLIVHGPLIATLLLHELTAQRPNVDITHFSFRAVRPLFDSVPFFLCGSDEGSIVRLFARDEKGALCMEALATLR
jgi:3-methylfumaryl-CoA hydratase